MSLNSETSSMRIRSVIFDRLAEDDHLGICTYCGHVDVSSHRLTRAECIPWTSETSRSIPSCRSVKLITQLRRISVLGAVPPLLHTSSWRCAQGQRCRLFAWGQPRRRLIGFFENCHGRGNGINFIEKREVGLYVALLSLVLCKSGENALDLRLLFLKYKCLISPPPPLRQ
jgi:hypothetical protein